MPLRLYRYIFGSVLGACLGGVGVFVFVLITGNAIRDILGLLADGRLTLGIFAQLLLLLIPYAVSFALPLGMLIGILVVMGRLSASHEITAMKASGISLKRISLPVIAVALLGVLVSGYINSWYAPAARASYKRILSDLVRSDPLRFIIPGTFVSDFPGYVIYVGEKSGGNLRDFWIWELDAEKRATKLLRADRGNFAFDAETDSLVLTVENGFTEVRDEKNPDALDKINPVLSFRRTSVRIPLASLLGTHHRPLTLSFFTLPELWTHLGKLQARAPETQEPTALAKLRRDLTETRYQISRRLAMAGSILSLALLGIPLGIQANRTETMANAGIAIALAMSYYAAMLVVDWTKSNPSVYPYLVVWIPNLLCAGIGLWLIRRANSCPR